MPKQRLYFDYAASTPVAPEVEAVMRPYFLDKFGNAGSLHSFGQEAIAALDAARETLANSINAGFREIIFTGSATEANNLAIRGIAKSIKYQVSSIKKPRIIVSAIEHESVLETMRDLEKNGAEIVYLPISKKGIVDLKKLKEALNERTVLVSVMYANNEIGSIQPIAEISKIIKEFKSTNSESNTNKQIRKFEEHSLFADGYPLLHTDAVQAFQFLDCDVEKLGVDLMTLSGHKIYGPKGVGMLYVRQMTSGRENGTRKVKPKNSVSHVAVTVSPMITGGGQEFGLRSGTENIPLIVGFAKAVELVSNSRRGRTGALARRSHWRRRESENKRISKLRDYLWKEIKKIEPKAERNGDTVKVLPNFLNIYFPGRETQDLLTGLDLEGIAVSAGSACSARSVEHSHVIKELGAKREQTGANIRITLGKPTSKKDIDTLSKIIRKLMNAGR